jgi:hypothetical protein
MAPRVVWLAIALLALSGIVPAVDVSASEPRQPPQAAFGPGGSAARYAEVESWRVGVPPTGAWIFAPASPATDQVAETDDRPWPLVIFFHGLTALDPAAYGKWIDHMVRRGNVVVYPDYQTARIWEADPTTYLANAIVAIGSAVGDLDGGEGKLPLVDLDRVAVAGHSAGGVLTVNYAAVAAQLGLPVPDVLMPVEPGGCGGCGFGDTVEFGIPIEDLSRVSPTTMVLVLAGENDRVVGQTGARVLWERLEHISLARRDFVVVRSDDHGAPDLTADHFFPLTGSLFGETDALDWNGTWRLFDALAECAFFGETCEMALGGGEEQQAMGEWSDGTPVMDLIVTDAPAAAARDGAR